MSNYNSTNINNLDLNQAIDSENYAIQELSDGELENTTGGFILSTIAGASAIVPGATTGAMLGFFDDGVKGIPGGAKKGGKTGYGAVKSIVKGIGSLF